MSNWPYDKIFQQPKRGLVLEKHIEYKQVGKKLHKTTITRRFYGEDDYQDSTVTEVFDMDDKQ